MLEQSCIIWKTQRTSAAKIIQPPTNTTSVSILSTYGTESLIVIVSTMSLNIEDLWQDTRQQRIHRHTWHGQQHQFSLTNSELRKQ